MSPAQANWLASNKRYRAVHITGGPTRFVERGMLHEDGTYDPFIGGRPSRVTVGCFEVGIFEVRDPTTGQWVRS